MDALGWQKGKNMKGSIEHSIGGQIDLVSLAVVMILVAREHGLTLEEVVHELILAQDYEGKADVDKYIHDLGY